MNKVKVGFLPLYVKLYDDVCPEYISFAACVNKVTDAVSAWDAQHEGSVVSDD